MKILKRNYIHRNLILFLATSIVFQAALKSISSGQSLISYFIAMQPTGLDFALWTIVFITLYFVYKVYAFSDKLVLLSVSIISVGNFYLLNMSFNKLVLGLAFIYLLFAFYFYITWEIELRRACFCPGFNKKDLIKNERAVAKIIFKINDEELAAFLTNMDDNSAFVIFENTQMNKSSIRFKKNDLISISSNLEGVSFKQNVRVVTSYDVGVGVEYLRTEHEGQLYDYSELFRIYLDRGVFI